jgi:hypothetical protein
MWTVMSIIQITINPYKMEMMLEDVQIWRTVAIWSALTYDTPKTVFVLDVMKMKHLFYHGDSTFSVLHTCGGKTCQMI